MKERLGGGRVPGGFACPGALGEGHLVPLPWLASPTFYPNYPHWLSTPSR